MHSIRVEISCLSTGQAERLACHWQPNAFCGLTPTPTLDGPRAEGQREEKITPVWPCEPLCAPLSAEGSSHAPQTVWASFREFAEAERKSRRKNRRFCGAGSLTTARSAGSCGVLKGRCSVHGIVAMTPFSVKFSCLLRAAKSRRGVPGLLWHEYRPQELRCLNKYRPASPQGSRQKL